MKSLLLIGSIPPPIGGVTVHCKRSIEFLNSKSIPHDFVDIKKEHKCTIICKIINSRLIHLHLTNSIARLILILFCNLLRKKIYFTFHGNIGRYSKLRNTIDILSIVLAHKVFTLNKHSYLISKKINKNTEILSAFIKPTKIEKLCDKTRKKILNFNINFKKIFCTNAYNVSFDKNKCEIYQISNILKIFNSLPDYGIIFSDPSANYLEFLKKNEIKITNNILILNHPHDFNEIITLSHAFIRYTTTDGDSISVKESLSLGKQVIASDVVSRPLEVITVSTLEELKLAILNLNIDEKKTDFVDNSQDKLIDIYCKELNIKPN